MEYEIHTQCPECDGYGIHEHQIAVDEFKESDCHECDGSGLVMHTEVYDSEEDLRNILRSIPWDVRIIGEEYMNKHFTGKEEFNLPSKKVYYNYRQHTFSSSELRSRIQCKTQDK